VKSNSRKELEFSKSDEQSNTDKTNFNIGVQIQLNTLHF